MIPLFFCVKLPQPNHAQNCGQICQEEHSNVMISCWRGETNNFPDFTDSFWGNSNIFQSPILFSTKFIQIFHPISHCLTSPCSKREEKNTRHKTTGKNVQVLQMRMTHRSKNVVLLGYKDFSPYVPYKYNSVFSISLFFLFWMGAIRGIVVENNELWLKNSHDKIPH